MKKVSIWLFALAVMAASPCALASGYAPAISNGAVVPGVWNSSLANCRQYVKDHPGTPMMLVWSKIGCHNCENFDQNCLTADVFKKWQAESGMVFCYINHQKYDGYELDWIGGNHSNDGCDPNYLSAAPFVRVYWYDAKGKKITDVRFSGINLKTDRTKSTVENLIIKLTGLLPGWQAKPAYEGGTFVTTNVVGACMEAEPSTKTLNIPLTRTATTAYTQTMTIKKQTKLLTATSSSSVQISWAADETEKILPIENFYPDYYEDGATYELSLTNAEGKVESSTIVRCVPAQANSSMNPYWIGERTAETLEWGDWTMDLEAASNKVANTEGACLIMYIGGELWCPWCEKGEKNFLSSKEFKDWTAQNKAVIAQIDCPKQHVSSPTLLSDEVNTSGIAPNGIASGSGYLTRKMADREIAREIFERNYNIVSNAFRRPESSAWRTGMGTFILIDRTFRVVGRLEWKRGDADESKRTEEQLKADIASNILRLNELYSLMAEEAEEGNQNWYTTKAEIAPIATVTNNTLSASDRIDTFRIPAASVGQTQMYSVKTKESANLTLKVIRVPAGSGPIVAGNEQVLATSGLMKDAQSESEDVSVSLVVPDANCYVVVEGDAATTFKTDYQTSNTNSTLRAYTLDSDAVLIPKEVRATAESKPGTATVQMKLEKDAVYRLEGLDEAACAEFVTPVAGKAGFYTALADGVAPLVLKVQLSTGTGTVTYQKWVDGDIGFVKTGDSVKEDVCDKTGEPLKIAVSRAGGVSGKVIARVTLSEKTSLLAEDAEHPRFVFEQTDLVWEEGVATNQYVNLRIIDYNDVYYGEGNVVLDVELLPDPSGESGSTVRAGHAEYKLFVSELNVRAPGRALVTRAEPYFAKKQTVYVREGEDATFYVKRIENQDGLVNAIVKSSVKGVSFDTDDWRDFGYESDAEAKAAREKFGSLTNEVNFYWSHHESVEKPIRVRGVKKGQTAKISLTAYNMKGTPAKQQFRIVAASNYVNVVGVAANAPAFEDPSPEAWFANRYVADSRVFKLAGEPAGKVTFVKTLGTLPAGLKASYDEGENALRLSGVPTCKAGTYTVVYQVKDGTVAGLTCEITIVVSDPTDVKGAPEYANPAVAKSRTLKNIPAFQKDAGGKVRLVGSLQVTIPPKGNVSAKLTCAAGTVAFSAKSWSKFNSEGEQDRALYADPVSKNGYAMEVKAETNGCVRVIITPPGEDVELILATSAGTSWSSANNAKAWNGYYTVALPVTEGAVREEVYGTAPRGVGYLTLKMTTATAWNKGTFTYGGMLPNGTAVSGSAVLVDDGLVDGEGYSWGMLPLFKKSSTDLISLPIDILKDAVGLHGEKPRCVLAGDKVDPEEGAVPQWTHAEKDAEAQAGYAADLDICGSLYLTTEPLTRCCDEGYSTEQNLSFTVAKLGSLNGGTPSGLSQPIKITVEDNALKADSTQLTAEKVTFRFVRSTGLVSGTWKLPYTLDGGATWKYVSATWKGVVLTGWGDCCIPENARPFVNGSFYFTEKRSYEKAGRQKTVTLKRGGALEIQ